MDDLDALKARMAYPAIDVGAGWIPIVTKLNRDIELIAPDYRVDQVKEKFGGLRYYYTLAHRDRAVDDAVRVLVDDAEFTASRTCETCGQPGKLRADKSWYQTLCDECAGKRRNLR